MKKYKFWLIYSICFIIILFIHFGFNVFNDYNIFPSAKVFFLDNNKLEIFSDAYNTDLIEKIDNGVLVSQKEKLNTNKLGKYEYTITIEDEFHKIKEIKSEYTVIDSMAPTIKFKNKLTTVEGVKINLLNNVSAIDNSKENIKVEIDGEYDFNKIGTYELYYKATDSSGNTKKEKFSLVVEKKKEVINIPDKTSISSKGYTITTKNGKTYIDGILIVNKSYGISPDYNPGLNNNVKIQAEKMFKDAKNSNFNMYIGSGFRSYKKQNKLYNNYVKIDGKKSADTYSARPGHSEHQTGLAIDVCASDMISGIKYPCVNSKFDNTPPAKWLNDNAHKYGFIIRYPKGKNNETGYKYESWHLRYVGVELATKLYNNGNWITVESYYGITSVYS
jgi:LAS superfamily LD-carboxypeptidase LdcB